MFFLRLIPLNLIFYFLKLVVCWLKKVSGMNDEQSFNSYGGHTHMFLNINYASGRVFRYPVKEI